MTKSEESYIIAKKKGDVKMLLIILLISFGWKTLLFYIPAVIDLIIIIGTTKKVKEIVKEEKIRRSANRTHEDKTKP